MKKIKLLYIIDTLQRGGTENQLVALIDGLKKKNNYDIEVICLNVAGEQRLLPEYSEIKSFGIRSFFEIKKIIWLIRWLRAQRIDIVHTYFVNSNCIGAIAAYLAGIKHIITSRRDLGFWYTPKTVFTIAISNMVAEKIVVNSNAIKKITCKKENVRAEKVLVIPNSLRVDISEKEIESNRTSVRSRYAVSKKTMLVGIVANFNRSVKRLDLFIEAARAVLTVDQSIVFMIVGEGNQRHFLEERIKHYDISENVILTGAQDNPIEYICAFDIAVNCSDSEGFSNAVLEYMICGVPVVATRNEGNEELVLDNELGFTVPIGDAQKLADAILKLTHDSEMRQRFGASGRLYVKNNFKPEICFNAHDALYQTIAGM
jgi:glycosyltransferase involved in cell wall biosynthesis